MLAILASDKSETFGHHARGTAPLLSSPLLHARTAHHKHRSHILIMIYIYSLLYTSPSSSLGAAATSARVYGLYGVCFILVRQGVKVYSSRGAHLSHSHPPTHSLSLPALTPWAWTARMLVGRSCTPLSLSCPSSILPLIPFRRVSCGSHCLGYSPAPDEEHRPC